MTYFELRNKIDRLSAKELEQTAYASGEHGYGPVNDVWVLEEDHVNPSGDGIEPISVYPEDQRGELKIEVPKGAVFLTIG